MQWMLAASMACAVINSSMSSTDSLLRQDTNTSQAMQPLPVGFCPCLQTHTGSGRLRAASNPAQLMSAPLHSALCNCTAIRRQRAPAS